MKKERLAKENKWLSLKINLFLNKNFLLILIILATIIAILIRYFSFEYCVQDLGGIVFNWMKNIESVGFKNFYTISSDYSPLYVFMIAIGTLFPHGSEITNNGYTFYASYMYYLKSILCLMDILSAIGLALIVNHITKNKTLSTLTYVIFLILPVQYINSALWGNNDSMYFVCFVYAIYFILKKKDFLVYGFIGLALSLKLQAVFILPLIVYLILSKKIKFYPIFMIPLVVFLTFLPEYICGAPFNKPFEFYGSQVSEYSNLTLGCANFWHIISFKEGDSTNSVINNVSPYIGLAFIFVLTCIIYLRKIDLNDRNIVLVSTFLIAIVPFFLPHMHERYFYALEGLTLIYCLIHEKKRYHYLVLTQVSGLIAYYHYISGKYFIEIMGEDSVTIAAFINLFVLTCMFIDLMKLDHKTRKEDIKETEDEIKEVQNQLDEISKEDTNLLSYSKEKEEQEKTQSTNQ